MRFIEEEITNHSTNETFAGILAHNRRRRALLRSGLGLAALHLFARPLAALAEEKQEKSAAVNSPLLVSAGAVFH
jgi:hypothetical protein